MKLKSFATTIGSLALVSITGSVLATNITVGSTSRNSAIDPQIKPQSESTSIQLSEASSVAPAATTQSIQESLEPAEDVVAKAQSLAQRFHISKYSPFPSTDLALNGYLNGDQALVEDTNNLMSSLGSIYSAGGLLSQDSASSEEYEDRASIHWSWLTMYVNFTKEECKQISDILTKISIGAGVGSIATFDIPGIGEAISFFLGVVSTVTAIIDTVFSAGEEANGISIPLLFGFIPRIGLIRTL